MIATFGVSLMAGLMGILMPLTWGSWGYLCLVALCYLALVPIMASVGTAGYSLEDGILLFEGSVVKYAGFVAEMAFRQLAFPLFILSTILIFRFRKVSQ
ncbi:MAG: hypothetical protein ACU0BB_00450 [Paracoccaceae bacterium]